MRKTALVTGGTKGIGRAIVERLWNAGYAVATCARSATDLRALEAALAPEAQAGQRLLAHVCDVSQADDVATFAENVEAWCAGSLHVLVNNAGAFLPGGLAKGPEDVLGALLTTNVMSAYWMTRAVLPCLENAAEGADIVNMISTAGQAPYPAGPAYSVSKFAMRGWSLGLRRELQDTRVKVTGVVPGPTWTPSWEGSGVEQARIMAAEDVAEAVYNVLQLGDSAVVEELVLRPQRGDL